MSYIIFRGTPDVSRLNLIRQTALFSALSRVYLAGGIGPSRDGAQKHPVGQTACQNNGMKHEHEEGIPTYASVTARQKGTGPDSAGQSGDTQGLSDAAEAGSESVEELVEEGQSFEADVIEGVEDAPEPDVAEVHTRQVPEDDVPSEYLDQD